MIRYVMLMVLAVAQVAAAAELKAVPKAELKSVVLSIGGEFYELGDLSLIQLDGKVLLVASGPAPPISPQPADPPIVPQPADPPVVTPDPPVVKPPDPTQPPAEKPAVKKVTQVTYVFERENNVVPKPVSVALQRLNGAGILASAVDKDAITGIGEKPKQYAVALKAALEAGLPALVVQAGDVVVRVVKNPTTEKEVLEAVK